MPQESFFESPPKDWSIVDQRQFIAAIIHDLKVPVLSNLTVLDLLAESRFGELSEEQANVLKQLRGSNHALLRLISNMQHLYKREHADNNVNKTVIVDLNEIIQNSIAEFEPIATADGLRFAIDLEAGTMLETFHPSWLERLVANLIDNAISFSPRLATINVCAKKEQKTTILKVTDQGPKFSSGDNLKSLERPWQRDSFHRYPASTDLSLYVCKKIAAEHGGTIDFQYIEEIGNVVTVALSGLNGHLLCKES